ncbi:MAG: hypothetical protein ACK5HR_05815 [Mycoplasmatales bacterium]
MLNIYTNVVSFEDFVEQIYEQLYNNKVNYEQLKVDFDVLILNKSKYIVEDISEYLEFYKYKALEKEKKLAIINNFDLIDIKSQNKLLKLFEENQENHLLVVNNLSKLLPTIKSRATIYQEPIKLEDYQAYPKRYWNILQFMSLNSDASEIDFYLKFFDTLMAKNYHQAYIKLVTSNNYNEQIIYEIIQYTHQEVGKLEMLLALQQRLFTKTNKKLQIENYLLQRIKAHGTN